MIFILIFVKTVQKRWDRGEIMHQCCRCKQKFHIESLTIFFKFSNGTDSRYTKYYCKNCFNKHVGIDENLFGSSTCCSICNIFLIQNGNLKDHFFYNNFRGFFNFCSNCAKKIGVDKK